MGVVFRLNIVSARPLWKYWINNKGKKNHLSKISGKMLHHGLRLSSEHMRFAQETRSVWAAVCVVVSSFFSHGFLAPRHAHAGRVTTVIKAESWEIGHRKM